MSRRNMDDIYFKVYREGKFENVCFSDLTDKEMVEVMKNKDTNWLKSLCLLLGKRLRAIGDEFDIVLDCE